MNQVVCVHDHRRRGSLYVVVLGSSMLVVTIGVASLLAVRTQRAAATESADYVEARLYAQSAVEIGQWIVSQDHDWRSQTVPGVWKQDKVLGRGLFSLEADDPTDGDFANNVNDNLLLTGTGEIGSAKYRLSVELEPYGPKGLDCLESAVHVSTAATISGTLTVSAPLTSNGLVTVNLLSTVNGDVGASGLVTNLGTINGTVTQLNSAKDMPDSTVFDWYIANATEITFGAIPTGRMENVVLSPTSNPFGGGTNPAGLYLIRCNGAKLEIRKSRIVGTLVILDPKSDSKIYDTIHWETTGTGMPALLVRGSMNFEWSGSLSESSEGTNFNPPGTPYQGNSDSDQDDTYPCTISGLIYVSGSLTTSASESISGAVVVGGAAFNVNSSLTINYDTELLNDPPPGFERPFRPMRVLNGSWSRVVN